jgi:hypothetical protein
LSPESAPKGSHRGRPAAKTKHERENHENRIERESSREKHWRHRFALDHVDGAIERRREHSFDDELGLLTMLTSPTLWGLSSYFLPAMA